MAFTDAQKVSIRNYLGWTIRFRQTDTRLEQALNTISQDIYVEDQTKILAILAELATIDAALVSARGRLKALAVGSITLPGKNEIGMLRSEGRRLVGRLAVEMGVAVRHDVFSGSGPRFFATLDGPDKSGATGGGNMMKQG
jgi:hypothetical protein